MTTTCQNCINWNYILFDQFENQHASLSTWAFLIFLYQHNFNPLIKHVHPLILVKVLEKWTNVKTQTNMKKCIKINKYHFYT